MSPQTTAVYSHLCRYGRITPMHALNKLGVFRLAARCLELRESGINVRTTMVKRGGKRFAEYRLAA